MIGWAMNRLRLPVGAWAARLEAAKRPAASRSAPRVLVRVDDYPHWSIPGATFRSFHGVMAAADVSYLLAATPFPAADPLNPASDALPENSADWDWLADAVGRGEIEVGMHGVTHRTRSRAFHSEFDGMPLEQARAAIATGWEALARRNCHPVAFVPPFDRLPPALWPALPPECRILCLGPESLRDVPLMPTIGTRDRRSVVLSLPPFYGRAAQILATLERGRWLERNGALIPITLHWTWEMHDNFAAVAALAQRIAPLTVLWRSLVAPTELRTSAG